MGGPFERPSRGGVLGVRVSDASTGETRRLRGGVLRSTTDTIVRTVTFSCTPLFGTQLLLDCYRSRIATLGLVWRLFGEENFLA